MVRNGTTATLNALRVAAGRTFIRALTSTNFCLRRLENGLPACFELSLRLVTDLKHLDSTIVRVRNIEVVSPVNKQTGG